MSGTCGQPCRRSGGRWQWGRRRLFVLTTLSAEIGGPRWWIMMMMMVKRLLWMMMVVRWILHCIRTGPERTRIRPIPVEYLLPTCRYDHKRKHWLDGQKLGQPFAWSTMTGAMGYSTLFTNATWTWTTGVFSWPDLRARVCSRASYMSKGRCDRSPPLHCDDDTALAAATTTVVVWSARSDHNSLLGFSGQCQSQPTRAREILHCERIQSDILTLPEHWDSRFKVETQSIQSFISLPRVIFRDAHSLSLSFWTGMACIKFNSM